MEVSNSRAFAAEVVGTAVLMLGGPGSAILAGDRIGTLGIAWASVSASWSWRTPSGT